MKYFLAGVALIVAVWWYRQEPYIVVPSRTLQQEYDYIIAGGGAAGCVLARRLTEDANVTVLLLEAGDIEDKPQYDVPWNAASAQRTEADWQYFTTSQKHSCKAMKENKMYYPQGRGLGGSTLINGLAYVRGSRYDYDGWAEQGCDGWSFDDVLPYFKKSEDLQYDPHADKEYHGYGGPLTITDSSMSELVEIYLKAAGQAGYSVGDCNGNNGVNEMFCRMQAVIGNGIRSHAARAFIYPVLERRNLHVLLKSTVSKVLIENKQATGVVFIEDGRKQQVKARREVILSAGAIQSPKILMLSGIGPKDHLQNMKIPVIADLPVGNNLNEHMMFFARAFINQPMGLNHKKAFSWWNRLQYFLFKSGMLANNAAVESQAFLRTDPTSNEKYPDIQYILFSTMSEHGDSHDHFNYHEEAFLRTDPDSEDPRPDIQYIMVSMMSEHGDSHDHFNYIDDVNNEIYARLAQSDEVPDGFTVAVSLLHGKSRGTVRLASTDPLDDPLIDPNFLENPDDVKTILRGIKAFRKLLESDALKTVGATFENDPFSMCKEHPFDSDAFWECKIRHLTVNIYHPTSSCRMGPASDKSAVVDPQLRVKGISNLRVVDASIMPQVTSGNTMAPTFMIAEKASDMIRGIDTRASFRQK